MSKTKIKKEEETLVDKVKKTSTMEKEVVAIEDMPLNTLRDYLDYNKKAREANKRLKVRRYPILQCPEELHPKQRISFSRNDQPRNPLPVYLSNEMIEYKKTLIPGQTYDLPMCIVDYLAQKGIPIWDKVEQPDGSVDSVKTGIEPRFALRTIYEG